jgi:hypothetical protein
MKKNPTGPLRRALQLVLLTATAASATALAGPHECAPEDDAPHPVFERIESLAGDWYVVDAEGRRTEKLVSRYRLTAGGSAVLETLFPGTENEMITLYHRDGEEVVLTHYCVVGNAITYRATLEDGDLSYRCTGGRNMESEDDRHMHEGRVAFEGEDRYRSTWRMVEKGELVYLADHLLERGD